MDKVISGQDWEDFTKLVWPNTKHARGAIGLDWVVSEFKRLMAQADESRRIIAQYPQIKAMYEANERLPELEDNLVMATCEVRRLREALFTIRTATIPE